MRSQPLSSSVAFKSKPPGWHSPLDLPMGSKWNPPSKLSIQIGDAENIYFMLSPVVWLHLAFLAFAAMGILYYQHFPLLVVMAGIGFGVLLALVMHQKTGEKQ
jgi:hypothetical protein